MGDYKKHYSVLFNECIHYLFLNKASSPVLADMTFGAGGHSFGILEHEHSAKLYSVDQDPDALKNGYSQIARKSFQERIKLLDMNFESFAQYAQDNDLLFDGIMMDLGVSSHQFDTGERGFSFRMDAPLDMRMAPQQGGVSARDVLHDYDEESIANIIYEYGEERLSRRIASKIVEARDKDKLETTKDLEDICFHAYPKAKRHTGTHPATRTFQALRIFVNRELEVLERSIAPLIDRLKPSGTLSIISFHSLEDRIVKHKFKEIFQNDKNAVKILTKRPLVPSDEEVDKNPRSRSAKLRVLQKIG